MTLEWQESGRPNDNDGIRLFGQSAAVSKSRKYLDDLGEAFVEGGFRLRSG